MFGPFFKQHGFPKSGDAVISPRVHRLLSWRGPLAVAGLIVAVVVLSFECLSFRSSSHVSVEVPEGFAPTPAHSNSASTVLVKSRRTLAMTSRDHPSPTVVGSVAHQGEFLHSPIIARSIGEFKGEWILPHGEA